MERRIDRIYRFVLGNANVTTKDVADSLDIQRTNASKDLNLLVKEGRLSKSEGRPVRYFVSSQSLNTSFDTNTAPVKSTSVVSPEKKILKQNSNNVFTQIIGSTGSMRNAVEQAKAAILYPPRGLNCLITGPTGSGKTFFAHAMFRFAQTEGVVEADRELVVFNCADYANNPELLMSHLFGYEKGAFTGADTEKDGLIQQADGGMLFLDEIHRLPPEGQEMIFYFMDHGTYSRLGETGKNRFANVRIVGATTEDPHSALLDTFVRRIPINIQMPAFSSRPAAEQLDLVRVMVAMEANRIQRKITLTEDVVKALLGSVSYGNVGQLKSNVQLICARGFMNHMMNEEIHITLNDLTEGIKAGLVQLSADRIKSTDISPYLEPEMVVTPNEIDELIKTDTYELPYNLYDIIGDKAALLKTEGLDQETINHFISTDINVHLKSFYKDHGFTFDTETRLTEFVDKHVIEVSNKIAVLVSERLRTHFQQNFIYAMSLHISSFLKKIHVGETRETNANIREMAKDYPTEFSAAQEIRRMVEKEFQVKIPESEDYYLTVLLVSLREDQSSGKIGVVVAAHGNSTASSMAQVVRELLDVTNIIAVDMPLDMHPRVAYEKIREAVTQIDEGSGVLIMVDMGSLATFNEEIQKETGIEVCTLDMVTTPLLIEAARKSSVLGSGVNELYESLQGFRGYGQIVEKEEPQEKQAILAICASGEGTAQRLKEIIERPLQQRNLKHIEVLTLAVTDIKTKVPLFKQEFKILATTGIVDPKVGAPYIPMEKFINQNADQVLDELLLENDLAEQEEVMLDENKARELCIKFMEESFTFINPNKLIEPLWRLAKTVIKNDGDSADYALMVNFVMHMAGTLERGILKQPLKVDEKAKQLYQNVTDNVAMNRGLNELESQLRITIPTSERYYIYQLLKNNDEINA
ncbi:sigma-54-dependent transcriptional regulator [Enterococcus dongliensis]|uniref:sigma-54-dependent transcriptional regulator n=1 Tax=Enterococcus dongliensis TaxID=2559925 RepID=UPI00288ECFB1|nr:sigma 54-interacting transcriptional regulator [Enterococcus dongliensis]MDT2613197.1 sigma 54-interacting transcriptional regulator [Enterococcus dongliensis]